MEMWDAYDTQMNKIEGVTLVRGEKIPDGVFHLVCDVLVRHIDGSYLIMQRDFRKYFGGMWEATAGGSAFKGETPLQCAKRELLEETGIVASQLEESGRMVSAEKNRIYVGFLCVTDWKKDEITLQEGETIAYKWVNVDELLKINAKGQVSNRTQRLISELFKL